MAENEKLDILLQVMSCVGEYPMPLENIAHDTGFSKDETLWLILTAICKGHPIKRTDNDGFYLKPVERNKVKGSKQWNYEKS